MSQRMILESIQRVESPWYKALSLIQNRFIISSNHFYEEKEFIQFPLPITTSCISSPMGLGSDSLPVSVSLFGIDTYLADSMQFMLEYGCRMHNRGCYYIMPSFRGEACDNRHLSQFIHSEAEIPGDLQDVMNVVEQYLFTLNESMITCCKNEILQMTDSLSHIKKLKFGYKIPIIEYREALKLIQGSSDATQMLDEITGCRYASINAKGEQFVLDKCGGAAWLVEYPEELIPFYQAVKPNSDFALNADLLLGYGEVAGCGERHITSEEVTTALKRHLVDAQPYEWYITMKEQYPLQTAGFGMGLERYLLWLLKCNDIRKLQILNRENGKVLIP